MASNIMPYLSSLFFWYLLTGTLLRSESKDATLAELQSGQEEGSSSIDHRLKNDNANKGDSIQNGFHSCFDPDVNTVSGRRLLKYVHLDPLCPSMHVYTGLVL